ncbi:MAG: protein phosphatase 2C domain-containing protein [Candidatus Margulisbacteria bacterium]|nr:protein phosphatase 2C domain-containing protein [Candidatus Margulisiibacteriota bacterium]
MPTIITGIGPQFHRFSTRSGKTIAITERGTNPRRPNNQDKLALWPGRLLIADGMGGHAAGETAAHLAVETISSANPTPTADSLKAAFQSAQQALLSAMQRDASLYGMGTTATLAAIEGDNLHIAHIGDGRVYRATESGACERLTLDHSAAQCYLKQDPKIGRVRLPLSGDELRSLDAGLAIHSAKNILTQLLGGRPPEDPETSRALPLAEWSAKKVEIDLYQYTLAAGDWLLLCTDGLWGPLGGSLADRLASFRQQGLDIEAAANKLVAEALALSGTSGDNMTLILYQHDNLTLRASCPTRDC